MDAYENALSLDLSRKRTRLEYANWAVEYCEKQHAKAYRHMHNFERMCLKKDLLSMTNGLETMNI